MFSAATVIFTVCLYMAILFLIAQIVERKLEHRTRPSGHPWVYALTITVFCTSWTFYGSVGVAAESGLLFTAIYIGAILALFGWKRTVRRMIRIKETYHISSIADFISTRYNHSPLVAALVTLIALLGIVPYIALQLKAIVSTVTIIVDTPQGNDDWSTIGPLVTLMMTAFTIMFGARHLDPTERHQGMMVALAVQSVVKLLAFLVVGIFVTYGLFNGFGDILQRVHWTGLHHLVSSRTGEGSLFVHWLTLIFLGAAAIQCLPRQFHAAVVENAHERHVNTAMWLVPVYLIVINLFVMPIAAAGLLLGLSYEEADTFVLLLPLQADQPVITMLVFIGGFSAAVGMIMLSSMTLATMTINHLLLWAVDRLRICGFLRGYLLQCRWVAIALILSAGLWFAREFSDGQMLVAMGMLSFVAVFQFVPALFGGMFWRHANRRGALLGLSIGLCTWLYTLVLPTFAANDLIATQLLTDGPWGIPWLRPEALLGMDGLTPISHSAFWSLLLNTLGFIVGSLSHPPDKEERTQLNEFMAVQETASKTHKARPTGLDTYISFGQKRREASALLAEYLPLDKVEHEVSSIASDLDLENKPYITIIELVEFHRMLEHTLAGSIGATGAHRAMEASVKYCERETRDLQALSSHILNELHAQPRTTTPSPAGGAPGQGTVVDRLQEQLQQQKEACDQLQQRAEKLEALLDKTDKKLFEQRMANQKLTQELSVLHKQIEH